MKAKRNLLALLASKQSSALRSAGFSASGLLSAGFSASDVLSAGFSASALRSAGFSASDVRSAGFSASGLLSAGFSASDVRSAGFSASDVLSAGFSASDVQTLEDSIPLVEKPYSRMLEQIKAGQRIHKQSTFGPDCDPKTNLCKTPMCTAGHLVNMGGELGYALCQKYDFFVAGALIHEKAHPGIPCQDFSGIPQEWAMAYIEEMAEYEETGKLPFQVEPMAQD